ncbi:MAG: thiamine diphosphokinase [Alistipes sp.]|nr:thiamine diphosphokinase [Alistipes sp.]
MERYKLPNCDETPSCVILAAGEFPCGELTTALLDRAECVICCDSAAQEYCQRGGEPMAIVGDMDSIPESLRVGFAERLVVRPEQDVNDLWKALTYATEHGFHDITVLGAFGRREDHSIGNIMLLAARLHEARVRVVGERGIFDFIDRPSLFESFPGEQVSLFTLDPSTEISVCGLRYDPPQNRLAAMWQGVSNEAVSEEFEIHTHGTTIVYRLLR